jgi:glycosyltransferase involved in cell wall biosynthesis
MEFANSVHIPNGVDTERFQPHETNGCREEFGIPKNDQVILFIAHSLGDHRKGIDLLLDALKRTSDRSNTSLLIVGSGEIDISELPSDYTVIRPGHIPGEKLPMAYSAADLFAIPSREDNCPLVILEAMACGTPVIGFPVGGIPELITDKTGWLPESIDAEALARTLTTALASPEVLSAKGTAARERACSEYSLEQFVERHEKLYSEVVF